MAAEPIELHTTAPAGTAGTAGASGHEEANEIVLDTRPIPQTIRHAAILGALGAIAPSFSLQILTNHNPLPLLAQLEQKRPGEFTVSYIDEGPEVWKLRLTRVQRDLI